MSDSELDLADRLLDGDLDAAAWERLRLERGPALDAALAQARAERAAIAGLPRPELPAALRERLLAGVPRPPAARGGPNSGPSAAPPAMRRGRWWKLAVPIVTFLAVAAIAGSLLHQDDDLPSGQAPVVARQEARSAPAERRSAADAEAQRESEGMPLAKATAPSAPPATLRDADKLQRPGAAMARGDVAAEAADAANAASADGRGPETLEAKAEATDLAMSAPAAPPLAAPAPMSARAASGAPKPGNDVQALQITAVWHQAEPRAKAKTDDGKEALREAEQPTLGAPGEGPGGAATMAADERVLRITLSNPGSEPLTLLPGSVRLVGVSRGGSTLWRTPLQAQRSTVVPAGGVATWDEPVPVIPPGAAHLRVEARGARSPELEP